EDLFLRLGAIVFRLPALRTRPGDIVPLARRMLDAIVARGSRAPIRFSRDAEVLLMRYEWPGNIRELRNAIEQAATLCSGNLVTADHLSDRISSTPPGPLRDVRSSATLNEVERAHTLRVIRESPTLEIAAATLGIDVTTLWRRRKRYRLDR